MFLRTPSSTHRLLIVLFVAAAGGASSAQAAVAAARVSGEPNMAQVATTLVQPTAQPVPRNAAVGQLGKITRIEPIRERPPGTGKGAVVGGVLGGLVGNQFGHGSGKAAMTVVGAAGGAVAGNNVERNINKRVVGYRVTVRLDGGGARSYRETHLNGLRVGDRVRVEGEHVRRG